jgi:hypothetical protein
VKESAQPFENGPISGTGGDYSRKDDVYQELTQVDAMNKPAASHVLQRIRAEYLEMPGLTLKAEQVQRLCGVDRTVCDAALEALVESGFLSMRPDGAFGRFRDVDVTRARPAKALLRSGVASGTSRARPRAS